MVILRCRLKIVSIQLTDQVRKTSSSSSVVCCSVRELLFVPKRKPGLKTNCLTLCSDVRNDLTQRDQLKEQEDIWPLPPSAEFFYWPLTVEEGLLSFLHLSAAVCVIMSLLGLGPLLQATMRHCMIYTHYFPVFLLGFDGRKNNSCLNNHLTWKQIYCYGRGMYFFFFYKISIFIGAI